VAHDARHLPEIAPQPPFRLGMLAWDLSRAGDCFSYAVAKANDALLLFKAEDFVRTDIGSAV
jgi:hypothetical protein